MKPSLFYLIFITIMYSGAMAPGFAATATEPQTEKIDRLSFSFVDVRRRAEALAKEPFEDVNMQELPEFLRTLGYDQYRDFRFIPGKALWKNESLPFVVQFFHRGFLFHRRVDVNTVDKGEVKPVRYSNDLFDYGPSKPLEPFPENLGFAGLQLFYPMQEDKRYDEFAAFLGASYFRAVGKGQSYGLSARGLAVDTGLPGGEEFPFFREFWLEKPTKDSTELTVYALLDSPSVTGAYRFVIKPGSETIMEVKMNIFLRKPVQKLGIAPLTSMFHHGENSETCIDDFRPEVHDSDGLLVTAGSGEWIWRPLLNPSSLRINSFNDNNPKGFGLMQRDKNFNNYQDLSAMYHKRPSAWVEPWKEPGAEKIKGWGEGAVQLVEIPTGSESNDNIVAFWVPKEPLEAGKELSFHYRIRFGADHGNRFPEGKTVATYIGKGGTNSTEADKRKFVIDFEGKSFERQFEETTADNTPVNVNKHNDNGATDTSSDTLTTHNDSGSATELPTTKEAPPTANVSNNGSSANNDSGAPKEPQKPKEPLVKAIVSSSSGKIVHVVAQKNEITGGWRAFFEFIPENDNPVELRCFLKYKGDILTETWSYQWVKH